MPVLIEIDGESRSFQTPPRVMEGNGLVLAGAEAVRRYVPAPGLEFVAIELDTECLAVHTGLDADPAHEHTVGFARFRMGDAAPSALVEVVHHPWTDTEAIAAARHAFESAGLKTALCGDFAGRIVDRLIRPYLNAVLRRLDEGLASGADLDRTLMMGLGYPIGPIDLLDTTGLVDHYRVSQNLYLATGDPDFAPAQRARIAAQRAGIV